MKRFGDLADVYTITTFVCLMIATLLEQIILAFKVIISMAVYWEAVYKDNENISQFVIWFKANSTTITILCFIFL